MAALRILFVHNAYQQRGGEDSVVDDEIQLLRDHGHEVELYRRDNHDIESMGKLSAVRDSLWSARTMHDIGAILSRFRPDVLHTHNTFPLISPSLYWASARRHVPIVQTLHNFRLLCPQAMLLCAGKVCEDCVGKVPWRGVARRCYRGSLPQSAVLASMLVLHRGLGTYTGKVTRYIALNDFCREVFVRGGLPAGRLRIKPNFVADPGFDSVARAGFLYVGRLSAEKGIATLAGALATVPDLQCEVIGTGPEEAAIGTLANVKMAGWQQGDYVTARMKWSLALVMPSLCYENFPRTLAEAFACGLPIIASRLGSMAALIRDGETGLLFEPGDARDLAAKLTWAEANPDAMRGMGEAARSEYESKYTPQKNLEILHKIYREAIEEMAAKKPDNDK
jgi:glycosyltransferase involved in cell wall biosynthesis